MLVLTRIPGQTIVIDNHIKVHVLGIKGNHVRIGIEAPKDVQVLREELKSNVARSGEDSTR